MKKIMSKTIQPGYYAIIPANVRYADITSNAKLLYGEITALCNQKGYCWATNQDFADLYGVSKWTVSRWVSELHKHNFINIETTKQKSQQSLRKITIGIDEEISEYNIIDKVKEEQYTINDKDHE